MTSISIFGLGYVGAVSAVCFANRGIKVIGVDPNREKVGLINSGESPIIEAQLSELLAVALEKRHLEATTDARAAVLNTDISMICVGTPSQLNGSLDLRYVRAVCEEIGSVLAEIDREHIVVIRSTMLPGSMKETVIPTLEQFSGKVAGKDFGVCINPEFLRESTAVYDFNHPPKTVIGQLDDRSGEKVAKLYKGIDAPLVRTDLHTAEMVKYTDNVWHALKVSFANEIGNICKRLNIDSHEVMDIFCKDTKLNLSSYYLKPGFAFGGSCLPKDVRALNYKARSLDLELPVINSILLHNELQIQHGFDLIARAGSKKVAILGFSFKAGTDDLRESPIVELAERLLGKGYDLRLYDHNVNLAALTGANKNYILNVIPHISQLMVDDIDAALAHAETIVIGNKAEEFKSILEKVTSSHYIIDLVRVTEQRSMPGKYDGICW